MKKTLLTLTAAALTSVAAWADQTTIVFDGQDDMAGLTRQTTTQVNDMTFVNEVSYSQDGVDLQLNVTDGTGKGYALVYAPTAKDPNIQGIYVSSGVANKLELTVPGGNITNAKLIMSGYALNALEVNCNGKEVSSESDGTFYTWTWGNAEGPETLTMTWPSTFMARYIHSIELTYTQDLGGKEASGLSFSVDDAEAVMGSAFSAPILLNPNKLPISWDSSDTDVASVDSEGNISILGPGKTTIKAETKGNDSYAAGNAQYVLTVIPAASNIQQLKQFAENSKKIYVKFPMTVTFASGSAAFVIDSRDNATMIWNSKNDGATSATGTIYKEGDVIPAGWMATYSDQLGFKGQPADVTETDIVIFPDVTSISYKEDADKVMILKEVTFTEDPGKTEYFYGTTPDGTSYKFENTYNALNPAAGTYDVKVVVRYALHNTTVYEWLAPIEYIVPGENNDPEFPTEFTVTTDPASLEVMQFPGEEDEYGVEPYTIMIQGEIEESTATITIEVPEGWDGFVYMDNSITPYSSKKKVKAEWVPTDELLEWGFKEGNVFEIAADGMYHHYDILLVKDGQADEANSVSLDAVITRDLSGLDLTYPETFDVTFSVQNLDVNQTQEVYGDYTAHYIIVTGETNADNVTMTLGVPEGWDGYVGISDIELEGEVEPLSFPATRSDAVFNMYPLSYLEDGEYPVHPVTDFTFPVDGYDHYAMCYLVKDDMFCDAPIQINVTLTKGEDSGISSIEAADADARYFNLQGVEVKNPEKGVFVKVSNGKAVKVNVK